MAHGLPFEGTDGPEHARSRPGPRSRRRSAPTTASATSRHVLDDWPRRAWWSTTTDIVLGRRAARGPLHLPADTPVRDVMQPAPPTVRPSITIAELAPIAWTRTHRSYVLVSLLDGTLLGLIRREDL